MSLSSSLKIKQKHVGRYRQILSVLFKYGFDDLISTLEVKKHFNKIFKNQERYQQLHELTRWERGRMVFQELGTTFIKLGQHLSHRPDLIPDGFIQELQKLQDEVPPFDGKEAKKIIEESLDCPVNEIFTSFEEEAYASASIAQVHQAILQNGDHVVVKVQRPDIEDSIQTDLEIMKGMAHLMQSYLKNMEYINPVGVVRVFEASLKKELDFNREGANIELFRKNIRKREDVYAPWYYKEYSSLNVLTLEYIAGFKVTNMLAYEESGIEPKKIAENGINTFFRQVLIDGYFHADPHAGNLYVAPNGDLCFIDFGLMGYITPGDRDALINLFIGVETKDPGRMVRALKQISGTKHIEDEETLELRLLELVEDYAIVGLNEIDLNEVFIRLKNLIIDYKIKVPPDFFLLGKALSSTEGICRKLYPGINIIEYLKPYVNKLLKHKLNPSTFINELYFPLLDLSDFLKELPGNLKDIFSKLNVGSMKVDIEHIGIKELQQTLEKVSNRISLSILIASMLIGSSLLVHANVPPLVYNIPLLGLVGFLLAVLLAGWLVISIIRGGNT